MAALSALVRIVAALGVSLPQGETPVPPSPKVEIDPVNGIVAVVDDHVITRREVEVRVGAAIRALADPEKARALWQNELFNIIKDKLTLDAAKKLGLKVEPKAVDRKLKETIEKAGGRETFLQVLQQLGQTEQQIREEAENQLLLMKYYSTAVGLTADIDKNARPNVDVEPSVDETRAYFKAHAQEFVVTAMARVRQIYLRKASFESAEAARERMQALLERISKGESFADLAKAESHDANTRDNGGDLGWIPLEGGPHQRFLVEFAATAQAGALSEVIEMPFGWYLFTLEERVERRIPKFEEVQERIVERLRREKIEAEIERLQVQLLEEANIWPPELKRPK